MFFVFRNGKGPTWLCWQWRSTFSSTHSQTAEYSSRTCWKTHTVQPSISWCTSGLLHYHMYAMQHFVMHQTQVYMHMHMRISPHTLLKVFQVLVSPLSLNELSKWKPTHVFINPWHMHDDDSTWFVCVSVCLSVCYNSCSLTTELNLEIRTPMRSILWLQLFDLWIFLKVFYSRDIATNAIDSYNWLLVAKKYMET